MTELDLYKNALIEINKLEAPSMLLEDYNYFINKAIQQYVNKVYNRYDTTQQTTDDLSALKRTAILDIHESEPYMAMERKLYYCDLPTDYLHILNCIVTFNNVADDNEAKKKCNKDDYEVNKTKSVLARRLTADQYPSIIINAYLKPTFKRPYFFINQGPNMDKTVLELRLGNEKSKMIPTTAYIDYIKTPKIINLTDEDLENETEVPMEFPEYVCYEIVNEFVKLLLENASDPRLQTNIPINQSIGSVK